MNKRNFLNYTCADSCRSNEENITYGINKNPVPGKCHLKINGFNCTAKKGNRGLCNTHYQRFRLNGTLEKFALPSKRKVNNGN